MKIAFFLSDYPVLTETFISNELFLLQNAGIDGKIWYEIPRKGLHQPIINKIKYQKEKITAKIKQNWQKILVAHLYWLIKNPINYVYSLCLLPLINNWLDVRSLIKAPLIAKQIQEFNPNIIYNHDADNAFYYALISSKLTHKPLVVIFHTYHLFHKTEHFLTKAKYADCCIFQSRYSKNYATKKAPIFQKKFKVISSTGIDTEFFKNKKTNQQISKKMKLVSIGRLEESKGFNFLIEAVAMIKNQNITVECQIIGDGSQKKALTKLVKTLKLEKEIKFLGEIPHNHQLIKTLSKSEIFVLPSLISANGDKDMQPNVIKEAMSMELLTVTSNLGGIKEVITDNINGFLLNNNDPEQLAEKLIKINSLTKDKKANIKNKARKTIIEKYEAQKTNQKLIKLFSEL